MDTSLAGYHFFFAIFAFALGAVVGSFLNVCIYRMPLDLSVNEPRRSFCPECKVQLKWYQNIPLLSWLFLRGRCANCGSPIAFRYFVVEFVTALLFLAAWLQFPGPIALAYWVFISLLLVGIFIDLEHFIIPDEVTIGGIIAGLLASFLVPALLLTEGRWTALLTSALSALLGYVILWIVLEAGKKAFGKKRIQLDAPTPFTWTRKGDDAEFVVGEEQGLWSDYFSRETDLLVLLCDEVIVDGRNLGKTDLRFHYNRVTLDGKEVSLDTLEHISGVVRVLHIPREAMGRGDLKFLAAIGAFLGWRAVLFSVFAGSLLGSLVGLATLVIGQRVWSAKLPFGPYLAFGALIWMFFGESLLSWYMSLVRP
jgi:leader peptidase (prepilin peptidase) / N-methyltransferase